MKENELRVALAQIAPVWLNKQATLEKVQRTILQAAAEEAELVVFGEGVVPGYPFWLALTDGAEWDTKVNKELHAHYARNSIQIEAGELDGVCRIASEHRIAVYLGVIERAKDRGGHSLYCSLVYIDKDGEIKSIHRKLQPTYDERLTWAQGRWERIAGPFIEAVYGRRIELLGELDAATASGHVWTGRRFACCRLAGKLAQHQRHHSIHCSRIEKLCGIRFFDDDER